MQQITTLQYNDQFQVNFTNDAFINATSIAKQFGKRPNDWLSLESTKEYIKCLHAALFTEIALPENLVVKENQLVKVQNGGTVESKGTWLHPKLAVNFARWLDVRFAVWCDMQIDKLLKPVPNALRELPRTTITGMEAAQLKKSIEAACKTNKKLYSELYRKLYGAYGIDSYLNLPAGKLNEALLYLGLKPVEMPKTVLIPVAEYEALKKAQSNQFGSLSDFPTITLSVPDDSYRRILVTKHKGTTLIYELTHDVLVGTVDEIRRDISTDYVVMRKEELIKKIEQFKA